MKVLVGVFGVISAMPLTSYADEVGFYLGYKIVSEVRDLDRIVPDLNAGSSEYESYYLGNGGGFVVGVTDGDGIAIEFERVNYKAGSTKYSKTIYDTTNALYLAYRYGFDIPSTDVNIFVKTKGGFIYEEGKAERKDSDVFTESNASVGFAAGIQGEHFIVETGFTYLTFEKVSLNTQLIFKF